MVGVAPSWALVKRELLTTLRGNRSFFVLAALTLTGAAYALATWPEASQYGTGQRAFGLAGLASREIMQTFSMSLLVGCLLLVPAYAAGAIVVERERSTFDFLSVSLIHPIGIVVAKMWNALGFFFLLVAAMSPIIAVSFFLIGVDPAEFIRAMALVVCTAFSCCAVGLFCSARFRNTYVAIAAAYIGILFMLVGPAIATFIVYAAVNVFVPIAGLESYVQTIAVSTSPPVVLYMSFYGYIPEWSFPVACLYQLVIAVIGTLLTVFLLSRPFNVAPIEHRKPIDTAEELKRRRNQFPYYIIDPLRRKKAVEDGRNPMLVREMRWGFFSRGTIFARVFYVAFVIYFFMGVFASGDARSYDTMTRWLVAQIVVTVLAAPALMSNALTKEYELGNVDMLRMTLLTPREIILGKLFAGATALTPALIAAVLSSIPVLYLGVGNWAVVAMGYTTLFACSALSLSLGLAASLVVRRTISALAVSYLASITVFVGASSVAGWVLRALTTRSDPFGSSSFLFQYSFTTFLSPISAFTYSVNWSRIHGGRPGEPNYYYWFASTAATLALAALLVALSIGAFHRYRMQDR